MDPINTKKKTHLSEILLESENLGQHDVTLRCQVISFDKTNVCLGILNTVFSHFNLNMLLQSVSRPESIIHRIKHLKFVHKLKIWYRNFFITLLYLKPEIKSILQEIKN